jgi:hypothetical protein
MASKVNSNLPLRYHACLFVILCFGGCKLILGDEQRQLSLDDASLLDSLVTQCPKEMLLLQQAGLQPTCVDRFEASRDLIDIEIPRSVAGAVAWVGITHAGAVTACGKVGKRLCDASEVVAACAGPNSTNLYPYGDDYRAQACNGRDKGIGSAQLTGSLASCEGGIPGLFDLQGNVAEWLADCGVNVEDPNFPSPFPCNTPSKSCCKILPGAWYQPREGLICETTNFDTREDETAISLGFRCCTDILD